MNILRDFEKRPAILNFFRKNDLKTFERACRVDHESQSLRSEMLTLDFKKILKVKTDRKSPVIF